MSNIGTVLVCVIVGGLSLASVNSRASMEEPGGRAKAIFAGGCFWCMEEAFEQVDGVVSVTSGYIGGTVADPSYEQVSAGHTGHTESVEIVYDPVKVNYQRLLEVFWRNIDPTTPDQQFCDHGNQYRSGIFFLDDMQNQLAQASKQKVEENTGLMDQVVTEITKASMFYPAEDYHQDFYKKNPIRYKFYKWNCGRAQRLEELWGKA
ncbi:MAG: peptide-methionine (S)-S-oxide reductase MsrA [Nitrospirales bacterium]|nr:peptide-methionine (S)-S-oxide reductase MsrA [Nitrospirales bacterium]